MLCSGAGTEAEVDKQTAIFRSAEVRDVSISVRELTGIVAYNPRSEGAHIRFEFRGVGDVDWRIGEIEVVTFGYPGRLKEWRAIY